MDGAQGIFSTGRVEMLIEWAGRVAQLPCQNVAWCYRDVVNAYLIARWPVGRPEYTCRPVVVLSDPSPRGAVGRRSAMGAVL